MSTLHLVRHGQAALFADDYDQLTFRGCEQARLLGVSWAARQRTIDLCYAGPCRRHLDTVGQMQQAAGDQGLQIPDPKTIDGLDEMNIAVFVHQAIKRVLPTCPHLQEQYDGGNLTDEGRAAMGHVAGMVNKLLLRWGAGESFEGVEAYTDFVDRVGQALSELMRDAGRGKRVAVITSSGPIAVGLRLALKLEAAQALALVVQIASASVSELLFTENRLTLLSYNSVGHLPDQLVMRVS